MTSVPPRPPFQPTLKALSTAQSSQLLAVAGGTTAASRSSSQARQKKHVRQESHSDEYLSERATISLIRRVLVADGNNGLDARATPQPLEAALPPLTSSNEVDKQLYAIIAIVIKDLVNTWYAKITPDRTFVEEVIQIIAHCSRALEQRLRQTDVIELLLNDIPPLVERHVVAYRAANRSQAFLSYGKSPRQIYHTLNPHPALDPGQSPEQQQLAAAIYRQLLVQGALAALLPTEDLQNSCLRILVADIFADLILGRAIDDKLCEGWFLHEMVSKVVAAITLRAHPKVTGSEMQAGARSRLEEFGLLSAKLEDQDRNSPKRRQSILGGWFWSTMQYVYLAFISLRFIIMGMVHARRLHVRDPLSDAPVSPTINQPRAEANAMSGNDQSSRLVLNYTILPAVSTLLNLSRRMPWLSGFFSFCQHVLTSGTTRLGHPGSTLDKFLYHTLEQYVFTVDLIPLVLKNIRAAIFPENSLGPPAPPPPSEAESRQIRRQAAQDLLGMAPKIAARRFFATESEDEMAQAIEEDLLEPFGDPNMNKHLIYGVLELLLVRLVPELAENTPGELLAERGVQVDGEEMGLEG